MNLHVEVAHPSWRLPSDARLSAVLLMEGGPEFDRQPLRLGEPERTPEGVLLARNTEPLLFGPKVAPRNVTHIRIEGGARPDVRPLDEPISASPVLLVLKEGDLAVVVGADAPTREEAAADLAARYTRMRVSAHLEDWSELDDPTYRRQSVRLSAPQFDAERREWFACTAETIRFPTFAETRDEAPKPALWLAFWEGEQARAAVWVEGPIWLQQHISLGIDPGARVVLREERP